MGAIKLKNEPRLVTGIYVRVSTEEQAQEGFSVRAQIEKLKSYALLKDWDIFNVYAEACDIIEPTQRNRLKSRFQRVGSKIYITNRG